MKDPRTDRWLSLDAIAQALPAMDAAHAAEVARGVKPSSQTKEGFLEAYAAVDGDPDAMERRPATNRSTWAQRREQFIARHLSQMREDDRYSDGFTPRGEPTPRMLAFVAWAYVPPESEGKLERWLLRGAPYKGRIRRNGKQTSLFGRSRAEDRDSETARRRAYERAQDLGLNEEETRLVRRLANGRQGQLHRIGLRNEAWLVPDLARAGWLRIAGTIQPHESFANWEVYDVRTTPKLHRMVERANQARMAYRDEFQQGNLFARRNKGQVGLFGTLPQAPKRERRKREKPAEGWFDLFGPRGAPEPGQKGYKPAPQAPTNAWDVGDPYAAAEMLLDGAIRIYEEPEARWLYEYDPADPEAEGARASELLFEEDDEDESREDFIDYMDMMGVPTRDGRGRDLSFDQRLGIARATLDYVTLMRGGHVFGEGSMDVIDPGKSRKGRARPKRAKRDDEGKLPQWAAAAIIGDQLAQSTPGYSMKLRLVNVDKDTARRFIEQHHSALPYLHPNGLLYALGAVKGNRLVAVATANTPTGQWKTEPKSWQDFDEGRGERWVDPLNIVELSRVASDGSVKGAASKLVSRLMTLLPQTKRGDPERPALFVTYQLHTEDGTSYKSLADRGLRPVAYKPGQKASGARGGPREDKALAGIDKIVWEYSDTPGFARAARWDLLEPKKAGRRSRQVRIASNPGMEVQSIIFDAERWSDKAARAWLREHGFRAPKLHRTRHTFRFRQHSPGDFVRGTYRTVSFGAGSGIQAVMGRRKR